MAKTAAADGETAVLEKIATWPDELRERGERLHRLIMTTVPELRPKLWYGMPGYAGTGPILCFFHVEDGWFSFGLTEKARLTVDDGGLLIPTSWFLTGLDEPTEHRIAAIVRGAVG